MHTPHIACGEIWRGKPHAAHEAFHVGGLARISVKALWIRSISHRSRGTFGMFRAQSGFYNGAVFQHVKASCMRENSC